MTFKKLALAAAIATVPAIGFSAEVLDDADLSVATGQDGLAITIDIGTAGITTDIYLHDKDGLDVGFTSYQYDGAIVIDNMAIAVGGAQIGIEIDAGDNNTSASAAILNVNVSLPTALTISTGDIYVANSQVDNAGRGYDGALNTVMSGMTIVLGSTTLNIQLGNEQQTGSMSGTDMIVVGATINGGLTINNFKLEDANSGGAIGATSMSILDAGGTALTVAADVNVTTAGLEIGLGQFGHATNGANIEIVDQYMGDGSNPIGDVSIVGLKLGGTRITIDGK